MNVVVERAPLTELNLLNLLGHDRELVRKYQIVSSQWAATWLAKADGVEAAAIGLTTTTNFFTDYPYLWLLTTPLCAQHPVRFIRWSRRVIHEVLSVYPMVYGLCRSDNDPGQRWLRSLGATFHGSVGSGFDYFRMTRDG